MTCPACGSRKARRQCPALGQRICPICCGTKRQVTIPCPADCGWLRSAQAHPPASVHRQGLQDREWLTTLLAGLTDTEYVVLTSVLEAGKAFAAHAIPPPLDEDLREAAEALAATAETALRGVIYDHQPASLVGARLAGAMREALEALDMSERARDAAVATAMRRLQQAVGVARGAAGDDQVAFWAFLHRVLRPRVADAAGAPTVDDDAASALSGGEPRIILP